MGLVYCYSIELTLNSFFISAIGTVLATSDRGWWTVLITSGGVGRQSWPQVVGLVDSLGDKWWGWETVLATSGGVRRQSWSQVVDLMDTIGHK